MRRNLRSEDDRAADLTRVWEQEAVEHVLNGGKPLTGEEAENERQVHWRRLTKSISEILDIPEADAAIRAAICLQDPAEKRRLEQEFDAAESMQA
jgi:hypothetical protein